MSDKIHLVRGDTRPQLIVTFTAEDDGSVTDITGGSAQLLFRAVGSSTVLATLTGTLVAGAEVNGVLDTTPPYDIPGSGGRVVFQWPTGALDHPAGEYEGELRITYADGGVQTIYRPLRFRMRESF